MANVGMLCRDCGIGCTEARMCPASVLAGGNRESWGYRERSQLYQPASPSSQPAAASGGDAGYAERSGTQAEEALRVSQAEQQLQELLRVSKAVAQEQSLKNSPSSVEWEQGATALREQRIVAVDSPPAVVGDDSTHLQIAALTKRLGAMEEQYRGGMVAMQQDWERRFASALSAIESEEQAKQYVQEIRMEQLTRRIVELEAKCKFRLCNRSAPYTFQCSHLEIYAAKCT
jgi:hypothetical protein